MTGILTGARIKTLPKKPKPGVLYMLAEGDNSFSFHLSGNDGKLRYVGGDAAGNFGWHAASIPPDGWLVCDGSTVSRTSYAKLFLVIGTTYGLGDGSTTFTLPDLRGEFVRGWDGGRGVDAGRVFGANQGHTFAGHNHIGGFAGINSNATFGVATVGSGNINSQSGTSTENHPYTSSSGGSETRPRNLAMLPIIKY